MRTSVQRQIGGYRKEFLHTGDLDMWMRAAAVADVGFVAGADQAYYRFHETNMYATSFSGAEPAGVLVDLQERARNLEQLAREVGKGDVAVDGRALAIQALKAVARTDLAAADDRVAVALLRFAVESDPGIRTHAWWRAAEQRRASERGRAERRNVIDVAQITMTGARDRSGACGGKRSADRPHGLGDLRTGAHTIQSR